MGPVLALALLTAAFRSFGDKPGLVLDALRAQLLLPGLAAKGFGKKVEVTAKLEGEIEDPEAYHCLDETWDWGDGTESVRETDCDPYAPGMQIQRGFTETHGYRPGQYEITLRLVRGEKTVIKGAVDVRIY
jgi:hypothetical protein